MSDQELRLVLTSHGQGEVWLDGVKIEHVRKVTLCGEFGEVNSAIIEILPDRIEAEGRFDVQTKMIYDGEEVPEVPAPAGPLSAIDDGSSFVKKLRESIAEFFDMVDRDRFQSACDRAWFGIYRSRPRKPGLIERFS